MNGSNQILASLTHKNMPTPEYEHEVEYKPTPSWHVYRPLIAFVTFIVLAVAATIWSLSQPPV